MGAAASLYIVGLIAGALFFGYLTDRLGRKKLFTVTLAIYMAGAVLTALAWDFWSFVAFRFLTGMAGTTEVPGVWVAGNATDLTAQVGASAAAGALAGAHLNADLVTADTDAARSRLTHA